MKRMHLIFGVVVCLFATPVSAFMSPSTLQLIGASIGPIIKQLLIVLLATIASMGIKFKRSVNKRLLVGGLVIIGLFLIIIFGFNFYTLKQLNTPPVLDEQDILQLTGQVVDNRSMLIELDSISDAELNDYTLIDLIGLREIRVKDSIVIQGNVLRNAILDGTIDLLLEQYNVSREDKLILLCNTGKISSAIARAMHNIGFDVNSAAIASIELSDRIDYSIGKEKPIVAKPFVDDGGEYIMYFFDLDEDDTYCEIPGEIRSRITVVTGSNIGIKTLACRMEILDFAPVTRAICVSELTCILARQMPITELYVLNRK